MAKRWPIVYLGFEDEAITDKHRMLLSFATNKLGGKPIRPDALKLLKRTEGGPFSLSSAPEKVSKLYSYCIVCKGVKKTRQNGLARQRQRNAQLPAMLFPPPAGGSSLRALNWICVRSESADTTIGTINVSNVISTDDWCSGADNWGEDEQNGNLTYNSSPDEDAVTADLSELSLQEKFDVTGSRGGGLSEAVGGRGGGAEARIISPTATAEIEVEGEEKDLVTIDTPTVPDVNLLALMEHARPVPEVKAELLLFVPAFISVVEEDTNHSGLEHVNDLLQAYQQSNPGDIDNFITNQNSSRNIGKANDSTALENYEPSNPNHGDKMFHQLVSRIQQNPGQIIRYCREGGSPLFLYPAQDGPTRCQNCNGDLVFELQLLPSIIPKLKLQTPSGIESGHLEFGSVYVFCCKKSCWSSSDKWRREAVIVQAERM